MFTQKYALWLVALAIASGAMAAGCKTTDIRETNVLDGDQAASTDATPAPPSAKAAACPAPFTPVDPAMCAESVDADYGLTPRTPAEWGLGAGTGTLWFGRLVCADGTMAEIYRQGNIGTAPVPSDSPLNEQGDEAGAADILDLWIVECPDAEPIKVYHNLYRCGSPCPPPTLALIPADAYEAFVDSQRHFEEGNTSAGMDAAERAFRLAPDIELVVLWWAIQLAERARYDEALKVFALASDLNPHDPFADIQRAEILVGQERMEEARVLLNDITARIDNDFEYLPLVQCLRASAMYQTAPDEARALASKACEAGVDRCC